MRKIQERNWTSPADGTLVNQLKAQIKALKAKLPPRVAVLQSTGIPSNAQSSSATCKGVNS